MMMMMMMMTGPAVDEIWYTDAEWHPDDNRMVKIETESKNPIWWSFVFQTESSFNST